MFSGKTESVNFEGEVSFASRQVLTAREKNLARKNLGLDNDTLLSSIMDLVNVRAEEIYYANKDCPNFSLCISFDTIDFDPSADEYLGNNGGVWTKCPTMYTNIWYWTREDANWNGTESSSSKMWIFCPHVNNLVATTTSPTSIFDYGSYQRYCAKPESTCTEKFKIINSNTSGVEIFYCAFYQCMNVTEIWKPFDLTSATTVERLFYNAIYLTDAGDYWYVPVSTTVKCMFFACTRLKKLPYVKADIATNADYLFSNCYDAIVAKGFDIPNCTTVRDLYEYDFRLVEIEKLENTDKITLWHDAFDGCVSLKKMPEIIDMSGATECYGVFGYCMNLSRLPNIIWNSNHNVTTFENFIKCCSSITEIPDMEPFHYASNFNGFMSADDRYWSNPARSNPPVPMSIRVLPTWFPDHATNVEDMFYGCKKAEDGIYSMYLMLSNKSTPVTNHKTCFELCGVDTVEGRNQLELIPDDWK